MKKYILGLTVTAVVLILSTGVLAEEIAWEEIGRGVLNLNTVLVEEPDARIIYAGSDKGVFKSEDGGASWKNVLWARGGNSAVNFLTFALNGNSSLYAATGNGLYSSGNKGENWSKIFKGRNGLENECTALLAVPGDIYLGTKAGLFISRDNGRTWNKATGEIGSCLILNIACSLKFPERVYIACADGAFRSEDSGRSWKRIFVAVPAENANVAEENPEEQGGPDIRYLDIVQNDPRLLYLATSRGVYRSNDEGKSWERLSDYGLLSRDIKLLFISKKSDIFAVSVSGIFEFKDDKWQELSLRLAASRVSALVADSRDNLYAAGDNGLFKARLDYTKENTNENILSAYSKGMPTIREIREAAIKYAEVNPDKINKWRKQAARRAWLPQLSLGLERNTTDLWHWEGGSTTRTDDDVLKKGRDCLEWDIALSWDLGELIWNDDQTSIDTRSKLMVELRGDVLDEVTKLYFERIRTAMELDNLALEDKKKRLDKELKIQELEASLDALTGGYFFAANH